MEFKVLGPLEVLDDERASIEVGARMQRAVLVMLLIDANRVVPLDRLIYCLWRGEPPATATTALQVYISNLRRLLEPTRAPRTPSRVIVTNPPGYVLPLKPQHLDSARFESLTAHGSALLRAGRPDDARSALRDALALWRGPSYAEFADEPFARAEVARLDELRSVATEAAVEADLALGRQAEVVTELGQLVDEQPLRERRWELLSLALYRSGRQGEALRVLARARTILGEELGVEPGPSLRRLENLILQQAPSLDWRPPGDDLAAREGPPVPSTNLEEESNAPRRLLVGREAELAELMAALERIRRGLGEVVLVAGEPGIGKTRLAEELADRALLEGALVAWGRCHEAEAAPAFWPWIQIVQTLATQADGDLVRDALEPGAAAIAQLVPEVKKYARAELEPLPLLGPEATRALLYEGVLLFMQRLAAHRPLILVIDDLHWADVASLELLRAVSPQLRNGAVLMVCTYRELEADMCDPVLATLALLVRQPRVSRIRPTGLSEEEVGWLIQAATGTEPSAGLAALIRSRTDGNPLFVSELVRLLASRQLLGGDLEEAMRRHIPAEVRETIRLRLARLPDDAVTMLRIAAVIGRDFDLDTVAAAADLDDERALELVEAALIAGVVVESFEALASYRFSHGVVRETLYNDLSSLRRARLHARIGDVLERLHPGDPPLVDLAHHFLEAAPLGFGEKAVDYALRLAERASSGLAFELAERQLRCALKVLATLPEDAERCRRELDVQLRLTSLLCMSQGYSSSDVIDAVTRTGELSRAADDPLSLLGPLFNAAAISLIHGQIETTRHVAKQLFEIGRRTDEPRFLIAAHWMSGDVALADGRLADARDELGRAIQIADSLPEGATAGIFLHHPSISARTIHAMVTWMLGDQEESDRLIREAVSRARAGSSVTLVDALFFNGVVRALAADVLAVRRCAEEALDLSEKLGFPLYDASTRVLRGWARAVLGEPEEGVVELESGLIEVRKSGTRMLGPFFLGLLADARRRAGQVEAALDAAEKALADVEAVGERFWEAELHRIRGEILADGFPNRFDEALRSLKRALRVARAQGAGALERRVAETIAARTAGTDGAAW